MPPSALAAKEIYLVVLTCATITLPPSLDVQVFDGIKMAADVSLNGQVLCGLLSQLVLAIVNVILCVGQDQTFQDVLR